MLRAFEQYIANNDPENMKVTFTSRGKRLKCWLNHELNAVYKFQNGQLVQVEQVSNEEGEVERTEAQSESEIDEDDLKKNALIFIDAQCKEFVKVSKVFDSLTVSRAMDLTKFRNFKDSLIYFIQKSQRAVMFRFVNNCGHLILGMQFRNEFVKSKQKKSEFLQSCANQYRAELEHFLSEQDIVLTDGSSSSGDDKSDKTEKTKDKIYKQIREQERRSNNYLTFVLYAGLDALLLKNFMRSTFVDMTQEARKAIYDRIKGCEFEQFIELYLQIRDQKNEQWRKDLLTIMNNYISCLKSYKNVSQFVLSLKLLDICLKKNKINLEEELREAFSSAAVNIVPLMIETETNLEKPSITEPVILAPQIIGLTSEPAVIEVVPSEQDTEKTAKIN